MAVFALAPFEGGSEIVLSDGKVTVGRGPFLRVVDKRVSRHHAIIEVSGSTVTVLPIHTNPTFYKAHDGTKFEPLEKNKSKELQHGDFIAFLPNDIIFKLLRNESTSSILELKNKTIVETKIEDDVEKYEKEHIMENENKQELNIVVPLDKKRKLPSWMTNKQDKTSSNKPKKQSVTETKHQKKSEDEEIGRDEEVIEEKSNEEDSDSDWVKTETKERTGSESSAEKEVQEKKQSPSVTKDEPKKRKRKKFAINDSDEDDELYTKAKKLPSCPYGKQCYRKNPVHFQEYSHDQSSDQSNSESSEGELPECPYGLSCYRRNRQHQKEYKHSATPTTKERKAKKIKTMDVDNMDDLENDYDSDDSFLNEESESSCEPSEVDEDSDWQPEDEASGEEDVRQLLSEAKRFARNKKMLKPT